jgi:hypothetical protein
VHTVREWPLDGARVRPNRLRGCACANPTANISADGLTNCITDCITDHIADDRVADRVTDTAPHCSSDSFANECTNGRADTPARRLQDVGIW